MSINDSLCPLTQRQFESQSGLDLTEERWNYVQNEIVGRMENFLNELVEQIAQDLSEIMEWEGEEEEYE